MSVLPRPINSQADRTAFERSRRSQPGNCARFRFACLISCECVSVKVLGGESAFHEKFELPQTVPKDSFLWEMGPRLSPRPAEIYITVPLLPLSLHPIPTLLTRSGLTFKSLSSLVQVCFQVALLTRSGFTSKSLFILLSRTLPSSPIHHQSSAFRSRR